jgi:PilZ domain-containing protein
MDLPATPDFSSIEHPFPAADAVLAEVVCTWRDDTDAIAGQTTAAVLHSGRGMLLLEATDPHTVLPPLGTLLHLDLENQQFAARLAEHGRLGRFLVSVGDRQVRQSLRLKVSLPATLRAPELPGARSVEIVDLTTSGARVRGVELPVGTRVSLDFTPPYRDEPVTVRALVAHGTHGAPKPWVGVLFRLVAMRGGR